MAISIFDSDTFLPNQAKSTFAALRNIDTMGSKPTLSFTQMEQLSSQRAVSYIGSVKSFRPIDFFNRFVGAVVGLF